MNKFLPFCLAAASCSLSLIACGDSSSVEDEPENYGHFREVVSEDELYACTSRFEGTSVFIIDEKRSFKCEDGTWYEIDVEQVDENGELIKATLKYAADDTVTSLSALPACVLSRDSMTAFVASIGAYLMCIDYEWTEVEGRNIKVKPRSSSSWDDDGFGSSSSVDNRFKGYSSGTANTPIAPSFGDSTCNAETEGTIKTTSSYYDYVYICRSGAWFTVDEESVDKADLRDTTNGVIMAGKLPNRITRYSEFCPNPDTVFEYSMYVYEDGWRAAAEEELCFNKACMESNVGDSAYLGSFKYLCSLKGWRNVNVLTDSLKKATFFNSTLSYGMLKDERDGQAYKTIKIGELNWMAENLNFHDSLSAEFDKLQGGQSVVYKGDSTGENVGRRYTFVGAMNLLPKYLSTKTDSLIVKKQHRGICPEGWHVPDSSEWNKLNAAVDKNLAALKSTVGWPYVSDAADYVPTNASGFSAVMLNSSSDSYCSASPGSYSDEFTVAVIEDDEKAMYLSSRFDKDSYCLLRCVENYGTVEDPVIPSSSSATPVSSSSSEEIVPDETSSSSEASPISSSSADLEGSSSDEPDSQE